jgi:predicted MFS family arabinose efflux permease
MNDGDASVPRSERALVAIVALVQFVNILDFMMVMPMGPDFAAALGIPTSQLGTVGGSYTASGCIVGVLGMLFLDRFPRRQALVVSLAGLTVGTFAGALAVDLPTLLLARVIAGAFGGPATSIALSIVSDAVPAPRRGRAMAVVLGAFSVASVVGVPLGLEIAHHAGWRAPFVAVGALGVVVTLAARLLLPPLDAHLSRRGPHGFAVVRALVQRRTVWLAAGAFVAANVSSFAFVPNVSALVQKNLGFPRDRLGLLYMVGGAATLISLRIVGRVVDRFGSTGVVLVGAAGSVAIVLSLTHATPATTMLPAIFAAFMVFQSARNVALQTLTSKVADSHERAGFQSLQSSVQHGASAIGAFLGSVLLSEEAGRLIGLPRLGLFVAVVAALSLPLVVGLERRLRYDAAATPEPR